MKFLRKISNNDICKVELLSVLDQDVLELLPVEGFFSKNSKIDTNLDDLYFTSGYAELSESGSETKDGYLYEQNFGLRFPTNEDRGLILKRFRYLKLIRLHLHNGKKVEIGRNDYRQNKHMVAKFDTTQQFTELSWSIKTIFAFDYS